MGLMRGNKKDDKKEDKEKKEKKEKKGKKRRVSDDPGRFLCNYLYFKSLQRNLLVSDCSRAL